MTMDQDFFVRRYAPVTTHMAFFRMPVEEFAGIVYERKKISRGSRGPVRCHEAQGPLPSRLESLLPLTCPNTKILLARHGEWTAYIPNGWPQGGDIGTDAGYLGSTLNIRVVTVTLVKDVPDGQPGSTQFVVQDGGKTRRAVVAHKESRWEFEEYGEPFPFEHLEKYGERRIKDRLSFEMVGEYCGHLGIRLYDPDAYEAGHIVEWEPLRGEESFRQTKYQYEYPNLEKAGS
jgi:hypothetical protein